MCLANAAVPKLWAHSGLSATHHTLDTLPICILHDAPMHFNSQRNSVNMYAYLAEYMCIFYHPVPGFISQYVGSILFYYNGWTCIWARCAVL